LIGVSAAAHNIKAVQLGRNTSVQLFNTSAEKDKSRILFDGRTASKAGAAFAGATQIGNLDAHDGFSSPKGHAGCGLFPGVLAFAKEQPRFMRANIRIQSIVRE
jgi:2-methylcitrate dehydratase PrpD